MDRVEEESRVFPWRIRRGERLENKKRGEEMLS